MTNDPYHNRIRHYDMASLVRLADGEDKPEPEVVYEFSNGRKFESTDNTDSGIYER